MKTSKLNVLFVAQAAMIAAIYVVLTLVGASFCLWSGSGPFIRGSYHTACVYSGCNPRRILRLPAQQYSGRLYSSDIIFGSPGDTEIDIRIVFTWMLRDKSRYLAPLPPILANTIIVPFVLKYGYMDPLPIPFMMLTVGIGEVISCGVIGLIVYAGLNRYRGVLFPKKA